MFSKSNKGQFLYLIQCSFSVFWEWGRGPPDWENKHVKNGKLGKVEMCLKP